jgi:hypothetical protein
MHYNSFELEKYCSKDDDSLIILGPLCVAIFFPTCPNASVVGITSAFEKSTFR